MSEAQGGVTALAFSRGKDCIGAWIQMRRYFSKVVPFYCADVPGLRFVEEDLRRTEDMMGVEILRYTSAEFFRMMDLGTWQTPGRHQQHEGMEFYRVLDSLDIDEDVRVRSGLPEGSLIAHGWRSHDSPKRRQQIQADGPVWDGWGWWFPVWDWTANKLEAELRAAKWKLPVDYKLFGRSFEGVRHRFLGPLKDAYPDDYARILEWFPLADADGYRRTL